MVYTDILKVQLVTVAKKRLKLMHPVVIWILTRLYNRKHRFGGLKKKKKKPKTCCVGFQFNCLIPSASKVKFETSSADIEFGDTVVIK